MVILLVERIFATSDARSARGIFSSSTAKDDRIFMVFPGARPIIAGRDRLLRVISPNGGLLIGVVVPVDDSVRAPRLARHLTEISLRVRFLTVRTGKFVPV